MIRIPALPLSRSAFHAFGDVVGLDDNADGGRLINQGSSRRFEGLVVLDLLRGQGAPRASLVRASPAMFPIPLRLMERHPLGSQLFLPLGFARFVIVVATPGKSGEPDDIFAFVTDGRQGVNYRAGVWHHPLLALDREADFLVVDRSPETNNCEEVVFGNDRSVQVVMDHPRRHYSP